MWLPSLPAAQAILVTDGPCTVYNIGATFCFRSYNYPADYGNLERCAFQATCDVVLSVTAFSTEADLDMLSVNGVQYSGTTGPEGVIVRAGLYMTWTTDLTRKDTGFEICATPTFLTPTPPTAAGIYWKSVSTYEPKIMLTNSPA
eukprot:1196111-Prorocentrum_minimum.AAC.2